MELRAKKAHELTSWPGGALAVYHCPTPSAFVPWSKDLEAEDPEKFWVTKKTCVAMKLHLFRSKGNGNPG